MFNKKTPIKILQLFTGILALSCSLNATAYQPFPGAHKARVINIDMANAMSVNFETWPGYARTIYITLPDLVLPGNTMDPPACELELAQKAMTFTREYLAQSPSVTIKNLEMETSADEYGIANVYTKKGSLGAALKKEGLARSSSVDSETPWCQ